MRVLHILDHGLPLHSGYTFRTRAIVKAQQAKGWEVACLTGVRQKSTGCDGEETDGILFYRTPPVAKLPSPMREVAEMRALALRLGRLVEEWKPDLLHAHSPVLNALPARPGGGPPGERLTG